MPPFSILIHNELKQPIYFFFGWAGPFEVFGVDL